MGTLNDCYMHAGTGREYWTPGLRSSMGEPFYIRTPGYSSIAPNLSGIEN